MAMRDKVPVKLVRENLERRVMNADRSIFAEPLADMLAYKPRPKDLRQLREDPEKWSRAVKNLAPMAHRDFGPHSHQTTVNVDMTIEQLAERMRAVYGVERGRELLKLSGLPSSLIREDTTDATILEAIPEPQEDEIMPPSASD